MGEEVMRWSLHQIPATKTPKMLERSDGVWVLYEDHEKARTTYNTLIEEQAARIAEMELAQSEYEKVLNSYADENQRLSDAADASQARLSEAVKVLEGLLDVTESDNTPNDIIRFLRSRIQAFITTLGGEKE